MKNKIALVAPICDFPTTANGFDYLIPDNFNCFPGELCQINFRNNLQLGVVLEIKEKSEFANLKTLQLLTKNIIFSPGWLNTVIWFSKYYHYSVGSTLKYFFPKFGKKINLNFPLPTKIPVPEVGDYKIFKQINISQQQPILIHANNQATIINYYKYLADLYSAKNKSIAIICPDQLSIKNLSAQLANYLVINLDGSLTDKVWRENWLKTIASGFKIILTTQKGCLAPINNLGLIIVDQENSFQHIQTERNPRFDARIVALNYAQNLKVPLIYTTLSISLFSSALIQRKELIYYAVSLAKRPKFKIIDHNLETVGSDNLFGPICQQAIKNTLLKNQPVFIFSFFHQPKNSFCFICGTENSVNTVQCKKCKQVLVADKKSFIGIKNELAKINYEPLSAESFNVNGKIYVGGLRHLAKVKDLGLTIILDADNILNIANFNSVEKLRSIIDYLNQASAQTLIICKNTQHHVYDLDFKNYLNTELATRKKYSLPPYGDICHVTSKKFEPSEVELFKTKILEGINRNLQITGPLTDKLDNMEYLIIKSDQPNSLAKISDYMYSKWILDRQPADLLR